MGELNAIRRSDIPSPGAGLPAVRKIFAQVDSLLTVISMSMKDSGLSASEQVELDHVRSWIRAIAGVTEMTGDQILEYMTSYMKSLRPIDRPGCTSNVSPAFWAGPYRDVPIDMAKRGVWHSRIFFMDEEKELEGIEEALVEQKRTGKILLLGLRRELVKPIDLAISGDWVGYLELRENDRSPVRVQFISEPEQPVHPIAQEILGRWEQLMSKAEPLEKYYPRLTREWLSL